MGRRRLSGSVGRPATKSVSPGAAASLGRSAPFPSTVPRWGRQGVDSHLLVGRLLEAALPSPPGGVPPTVAEVFEDAAAVAAAAAGP